ncbi:hypothetical protein J6S37_03180 [Candidatus Saccharibacteria bacterium]|nr:hypothetical protein [Candidatus Saccharibacteria bacterium]
MAREINLVPDIKDEMIRTLKLRNLIFFLCIVVAAASAGVTLLFGLIAGGQQLAVNSKNATLDKLSKKLNSYSDLDDFLTIKDQLGDLAKLSDNKKVLSRTFNVLAALIPTGADTITISELNVNLSESQPTLSFDAQANAGKEPFIDYSVLESFKKSMEYMRYDYGNYVDKNGEIIPAYCMIEAGADGATFKDETRGRYAFWTINGEGCNPSKDTSSSEDASTSEDTSVSDYATEDYNGQTVVRIWRTPQFSDWYKETAVKGEPYMSLDGKISDVAHFESACITYTGDNTENSSSPKWTEENESCKLIPDGTDGIVISDSSNGRDSSNELVLRFSATITLAPETYEFNNKHLLAIPPSGRRNVTDSYIQIQAMFGERATDCKEGDTTCSSDAANRGEN